MKIEPGIKKTIVDGKEIFSVNITKRSKFDRAITVVKKKSCINSLTEAQRIKKRFIEEVNRELGRREGQGKTWGEVTLEWKYFFSKEENKKYSQSTVIDYFSLLKTWTHKLKTKPINEISKGDIIQALNTAKEQRSIKHTAKLKDAIKAVYSWCIEYQIAKGLSDDVLIGISVSRKAMPRTEILQEAQIKKLLREASRQNHPWYEVWAMAFFTGMRSGEMKALTWGDINFEQKNVHVNKSICQKTNKVKETKTGDQRIIPLNDDSLAILARLKDKTLGTEFVFPRIKDWEGGKQAQVLRVFCESIGIPSICFHSLRACFATQLLTKGVGLNIVQAIGGWRDISTMKHYNRLAGVEIKNATSSLNFLEGN